MEVELLVCLTVKINYLCVDIADNSKTFKALLIFFAACERVKHITSLSSGNQLNTGAKLYSSFEKKNKTVNVNFTSLVILNSLSLLPCDILMTSD